MARPRNSPPRRTVSTTGAPGSVDIDALADELPRHISHLARMVYRATGSPLPRAMRSVVFAVSAEPLRISEVAETEGIGQSAATRLVARLESLGLVRRERGTDDRREVIVTLTDDGATELELMREQSRRVMREVLVTRDPRELRQLKTAAAALDQLEKAMRAHRRRPQRNGRVRP